jgi:hypothetical protein
MSGKGLKTYIKNVDCCLDEDYNMSFVLENQSDIKEIIWIIGFEAPWNGGGWLHKPDLEGILNNDEVLGGRLLQNSSDYKVIWNNGIIKLRANEGKTIPSGGGIVLSFVFGNSDHLPIFEGKSVIKIINVKYIDRDNQVHTIDEVINSSINVKKAMIMEENTHTKELLVAKEEATDTVEKEAVEKEALGEEDATQEKTVAQEEPDVVIDEEDTLLAVPNDDVVVSDILINEKHVQENKITITVENTSQYRLPNDELSLSLVAKPLGVSVNTEQDIINVSDYSFSFDDETTWKSDTKIVFPEIRSNNTQKVTILLHPDKINLSYPRNFNLIFNTTVDESNQTVEIQSEAIETSLTTYYNGNNMELFNLVINKEASESDVSNKINQIPGNINISLAGAKGKLNKLILSNDFLPSNKIISIKNLNFVRNTQDLHLGIYNRMSLESVVVEGALTISGQNDLLPLLMQDYSINNLKANSLHINNCVDISINNSTFKHSSDKLVSLNKCVRVSINNCEITDSLNHGIYATNCNILNIHNNTIDNVALANIYLDSNVPGGGAFHVDKNIFNQKNGDSNIKALQLSDYFNRDDASLSKRTDADIEIRNEMRGHVERNTFHGGHSVINNVSTSQTQSVSVSNNYVSSKYLSNPPGLSDMNDIFRVLLGNNITESDNFIEDILLNLDNTFANLKLLTQDKLTDLEAHLKDVAHKNTPSVMKREVQEIIYNLHYNNANTHTPYTQTQRYEDLLDTHNKYYEGLDHIGPLTTIQQ